jgi:hypothetical protein
MLHHQITLNLLGKDHDIAQVASSWLSTMRAKVQSHVGFVVEKVAGFLYIIQFSSSVLFLPIAQ